MFSKVSGGYRLYRRGDPVVPGRAGKFHPEPQDLPEEYRPLVEWYLNNYYEVPAGQETIDSEDPLLRLIGVGKELWQEVGGGEAYIRKLRESWGDRERAWPQGSETAQSSGEGQSLLSRVWDRIRQRQGAVFETKTGRKSGTKLKGGGSACGMQNSAMTKRFQFPYPATRWKSRSGAVHWTRSRMWVIFRSFLHLRNANGFPNPWAGLVGGPWRAYFGTRTCSFTCWRRTLSMWKRFGSFGFR